MNNLTDQIIDAYCAALDGRNLAEVGFDELMFAIGDAVPSASIDDIVEALRADGERQLREAEQLKRYHRAKRGQEKNDASRKSLHD
jgi:hypothetical protein